MATDLSAQVMHLGRSWEGTRIEDDCPCAKALCGLAISGSADCQQHSMSAAKTIRQMHLAGNCPMNQSETPAGAATGEGGAPTGITLAGGDAS